MASNLSRDEILKELKDLKSEHNYDQMIVRAKEALILFPEDAKFTDLLHLAQARYVHEKLESNIVEELIKKNDYSSLAAIYVKLLNVFPESKELKSRLCKVRDKIEAARKQSLKTFYENAEKKVKEFLEQKEYEDAIEACYEILDNEPQNKIFLHLLVKAENGLDIEMNTKLEKYYKEVIPALRQEYAAAHDSFIKL